MTTSIPVGPSGRVGAAAQFISHGDGGDIPDLESIARVRILRRAVIVALIVGSALALVNHSAAIFGDAKLDYLTLALFYLTPLIVATTSQMLAHRRAATDAMRNSAQGSAEEPVLVTALNHGIPLRALIVGLLIGSANSSIVILGDLSRGAGVTSLTVALLAQVYTLPVLLGLLSQTIAYRRAVRPLRVQSAA